MVRDEWPLPQSDKFVVKDTPKSGRAVFATNSLEPGTHLLTTSADSSPIAHIILRPYRREVCAQCFKYDRGREWKIRSVTAGVAFCGDTCHSKWSVANSGILLEAHEAVEAAVKRQQKRIGRTANLPGSDQKEQDTFDDPTEEHAQQCWEEASIFGPAIMDIRSKNGETKSDLRILRSALEMNTDPDVLCYLLSGVIAAYNEATTSSRSLPFRSSLDDDALKFLPSLAQLAPDPSVYKSTPPILSSLNDYLHSYRLLLAILPLPFLPYVKPNLCHELASRASHNAFSIRPAGNSDGEQSGEFLGWGVWPEASFFNHSCQPNVRKERTDRKWTFWVEDSQVVKEGDELCITYLGGDEQDLDVVERRKRLLEQWGFWCCCKLCIHESPEQ